VEQNSTLPEDSGITLESLPEAAQARLKAFEEMLVVWNEKINLISRSTVHHISTRHIRDSLQLLEHIPEGAKTLTDFGSGGGFPGIVLAIANDNLDVHLIESDAKKATFLREAARHTGCEAHILNTRVEDLEPWENDVLTARAFAPMGELLAYVAPFYSEKTVGLFLKGAKIEEEIEKAQENWEFDYELRPSKTDGTGKIVVLTKLTKRG
jgi:16S rRNA (guanine527-N7)-methyltransferase